MHEYSSSAAKEHRLAPLGSSDPSDYLTKAQNRSDLKLIWMVAVLSVMSLIEHGLVSAYTINGKLGNVDSAVNLAALAIFATSFKNAVNFFVFLIFNSKFKEALFKKNADSDRNRFEGLQQR